MFSLLGWTPSLRRILRVRLLPCGCSVGVYETYAGTVVEMVDARAPRCSLKEHVVDRVVVPDGRREALVRTGSGSPRS